MFSEYLQQYPFSFHQFHLFASIKERDAWEGLDQELRKQLVAAGEHFLGYEYPVIRAVDFLEFSRSGNREHYEEKLFARRTALNALALAECVENQGRFFDDILNGIYAICEESAWQLPAHNSYIRDTPQLPLPDVTRPVIDLFQAETGAVLAVVQYLLQPALDSISPAVCTMIRHELEERIFIPYLKEHFWWMGDGHSPMNNWTVWCTQNVLMAAACMGLSEDQKRMGQILQKACRSIDYFLAEYGEDGCCDEGAQYYRHAGLCLFNCLEILNGITEDHFAPLYQTEKVRNIAGYIEKVHVAGPYYINFSDCSPVAGRCNAREFLFGKRTENPSLMVLAASDFKDSEDPLLTGEHNLFYRLQTVFHYEEMMTFQPPRTRKSDSWQQEKPGYYFPSVGLFLAQNERYFLAVKAGDNDDSHNHNDTGSFTLYKDGKPFFIDIGVETYQKKTFSPQRYEIWTMQSQYHNLPSFVGCEKEDIAALPYAYACPFGSSGGPDLVGAMEQNGPEYAARDVSYTLSGPSPSISMEIADAYPDPRVRSYRRAVTLLEKGGVLVEDHSQCHGLTPVLSLITYEMPVWNEKAASLSVGSLGSCRILGAASAVVERLPITDKRLQTAWKHDVWRTLVTFEGT
ncbi:MAG: heparinase II/III family protein, partial [Lachnospiraceae bacterium]|nr:heparinase II/III family protein [Lachnospiraceae bacterium]